MGVVERPPTELYQVAQIQFAKALKQIINVTKAPITAHRIDGCPCCGRETPVVEYRRYDGLIIGYKMLETEDFNLFFWLGLK